MKRILMATLPFALAACYSVMAAAPIQEAQEHFSTNINSWMEGRILAIDAKANKFTIRGRKDEYATEYAKMLKDIANKTANMTGAEKEAKAAEIRRSYADSLANARNKSAEKESDFVFALDAKQPLSLFDERQHFEGSVDRTGMAQTNKEANAIKAFSDLKIGDHLIVGYDAGVLTNTAYAAIVKGGSHEKAAQEPTKTSSDENAPKGR